MRQIAHAEGLVAALVVAVAAAFAVVDLGVDQTGMAPGLLAAIAVEDALEVVRQGLVMDGGIGPELKDVLYLLEERSGNNRRVTAFEQFAVIHGVPGIVGIAEDAVNGVVTDRPTCLPLAEGAGAKPEIFGRFGEVVERVVAGGVELEQRQEKRCALGVNIDGIDLLAVDVTADVEIPDWCAPDGAAVSGLVGHLQADVFTAPAVLQVVHGVGDDLHELGFETVTEVFFGANNFHAKAAQVFTGQYGIFDVAEGAGA